MRVPQAVAGLVVALATALALCEGLVPIITQEGGKNVNNRLDIQQQGSSVLYYCSEGTWYFQNGTIVPLLSPMPRPPVYQVDDLLRVRMELRFDAFRSQDQGYYYCFFEKTAMSLQVAYVGVFVTENLGPVNVGFAFDSSAGTIIASWDTEAGTAALDSYTVEAAGQRYDIDKDSPLLIMDPADLVATGTSGIITVMISAAYAGHFYSSSRDLLIVNAPSNVEVAMETTSSFQVSWNDFANTVPVSMTIVGFEVQFKTPEEMDYMSVQVMGVSSVVINGLPSETKFLVRVMPLVTYNVSMATAGPFASQVLEVLTKPENSSVVKGLPSGRNQEVGGVIGAVIIAIGLVLVGVVCAVIVVLLLLRRRRSMKRLRATIRNLRSSPSVDSNIKDSGGTPFSSAPFNAFGSTQTPLPAQQVSPSSEQAITLKSFHSNQLECDCEIDSETSADDKVAMTASAAQPSSKQPKMVRRDYANINLESDDEHCIDMYKFPEYVKEMHQQRQEGFERQYDELCRETECLAYTANESRSNRTKNRFNNIFTFDHSRVVLETPNQSGSDYINASYINGHEKAKAYISAQGPVPETIPDFWLMVWEQKSPVVVMLTKVEEKGRKKCEQYWLQSVGVSYDVGRRLSVTLEGHKLYAECEVREFTVVNLSQPEAPPHRVNHFLFTGWPDHGVPQHPSSLLRFVGKVRTAYGRHGQPMVVHCSAGVGRSGTFIAIDSLVQRLKTMDSVNIYNFIRDMRHNRTHMVQTLDQYAFIHDSLFDYIVCGDTSVPASQLKSKLKDLKRVQTDKGRTTLQEEYELLNVVSMVPNEEDLRLSEKTMVARKNRYVDKYPYSKKYLYLLGRSTTPGSEYINASFVNSYVNDNDFIAGQYPLDTTVDDIWQLIWQFRCCVVITIATEDEAVCFWPSKKTQYDHILVKTASATVKEDYTVYKHYVADALRQSTALEVSHFVYKSWPKDGRPNVNTLIMMLAEVLKEKQGRSRPTLVMCDDGMDRTGTLICIASEIEHTKLESTLDVFQSVKLGRCQRPHLVSTQENYFICYETLLRFIESFDGYANFKDI